MIQQFNGRDGMSKRIQGVLKSHLSLEDYRTENYNNEDWSEQQRLVLYIRFVVEIRTDAMEWH